MTRDKDQSSDGEISSEVDENELLGEDSGKQDGDPDVAVAKVSKQPEKGLKKQEADASALVQGISTLATAMSVLSQNMGQMSTGLERNMSRMSDLTASMDKWAKNEYEEPDYGSEDEFQCGQRQLSLVGDAPSISMPTLSPVLGRKRQPMETHEDEPNAKRFLTKMNAEAAFGEQKGGDINDELANNITAFMRSKPEEGKLRELYDALPPPANCPGLEKILVNEDIWSRIPSDARSSDVKHQRVQTAMVKGVTAVAHMCEVLLKSWDQDTHTLQESKFEDVMDFATKAFKAFGAANFELSMRRRESLRSAIAKDYAHLCAPAVPFTDKLFGDDVTKVIKDISDNNRLNKRAFEHQNRKAGRGRARGRPYEFKNRERGQQQGRPNYYGKGFYKHQQSARYNKGAEKAGPEAKPAQ